MDRTQAALILLPAAALSAWIVLAAALFGTFTAAPTPVIVAGFYALPVVYLAYAFGYGMSRRLRRVLSTPLCLGLCCSVLLLFAWRVPALSHGVNGSDRPREGHILLWTLTLAAPGIGGVIGSLPDQWFRRQRPTA